MYVSISITLYLCLDISMSIFKAHLVIYFKEFTSTIPDTGCSEICRAAGQA